MKRRGRRQVGAGETSGDEAEALGLEVVRTREPGGSPHAEALREAILSGFARQFGAEGEALLFAAARIDHLEQTILPALDAAHGSSATASPIQLAPIRASRAPCRRPLSAASNRLRRGEQRRTSTLVLDIQPRRASNGRATRRGKGGADRFEAEGLEFHETLRRAFLDIAAAEPERCVVIDALKIQDRRSPQTSGRPSRRASTRRAREASAG